MSQEYKLISFPEGVDTSEMDISTTVRSLVRDANSPKIVVKLTTSIDPPRSIVLGYTCRDTVFFGVLGKDSPSQQQEDLMVLKETMGPKHGEPLLTVMHKINLKGLLRNNPFTLAELWMAFDQPEKFKDGVSRNF